MESTKTVKQWLEQLGLSANDLAERSAMDKRVVRNIVEGQWTPSPAHRDRIAEAIGVKVDEIRWGHSTPVEHMYGHGPHFGRSP